MRRLFILAILFCFANSRASDWPQFLGPARNGASDEKIASSWSAQAPREVWKIKVGAGFAGPLVVSNRVVIVHRVGDSEILAALEADSGKRIWESKAPTTYRDDFGFDEGPRAVPTIADGRIYSIGAEGLIRCVSLADGKEVWSVACKTKFKSGKGFFGMACSPLIAGDLVVLNIGGADGAGIVALEKGTGALRWKATEAEASYSSPVSTLLDNKRRILVFTREGLSVLDPGTGRQLDQMHWRSRSHASVNAATPLVVDGKIFLTASYETGAILLDWKNGALEKIWSGDDSLSSHYATPVYFEGYLFGSHGRQEYGPSFRAVEAATGKVAWDQDKFGAGTVTLVGERLLILRESGELLLADASPKAFRELGRVQILGSGTRAYPAVSNGRLYARDKSSVICVALP